ncbi:hypothetical protein [Tumebacillus flagellatus]|uniref:Uncharacterized protein n=1 Tax=Tumebacillus flagellatus TaxID=1157490 RepID=A0A074LWM9_9BACL|nr:hypothetical protein [Tumebacillus flagellatus]KEO84493.1 hypothetical protein EL26_05175 [Tumebacillus flagellatus]
MKPYNGVTRKDGGEKDLIKFDNPDDGDVLENAADGAQGDAETLVVVDNPDDFDNEVQNG